MDDDSWLGSRMFDLNGTKNEANDARRKKGAHQGVTEVPTEQGVEQWIQSRIRIVEITWKSRAPLF